MKEFIITVVGIILAAAIVITYMLGATGSNTIQGEANRIGGKAVTDMADKIK